jgi:hypothetical protein
MDGSWMGHAYCFGRGRVDSMQRQRGGFDSQRASQMSILTLILWLISYN